MIQYIVKFQNHYCFSFLFEDLLIELLEKGIKCTALFESSLFCYHFEMEDWPSISLDDRSITVPYNGSKFQLKGKYKSLFRKYDIPDESELEESGEIKKSNQKFYKIKYTLNMLPYASQLNEDSQGGNELLEVLGSTDELSVFDTKIVSDYYDFQW